MLLGPSYLSEKIAKGNFIVSLLIKVCQTSVTQFLVPPHFFLWPYLSFLAELSDTWQQWVTDLVADVLRNPAFCAHVFFLCAQWNLETDSKYYISRILLNCYFAAKMLIKKDVENCPAKTGNKMLKCVWFGFSVPVSWKLRKKYISRFEPNFFRKIKALSLTGTVIMNPLSEVVSFFQGILWI